MLDFLRNWFYADPRSFLFAVILVISCFIGIIGLLVILLILKSNSGVREISSESPKPEVKVESTKFNLSAIDYLVSDLITKFKGLLDLLEMESGLAVSVIINSWKEHIVTFLKSLTELQIPKDYLKKQKFLKKRSEILAILGISQFSSLDEFLETYGTNNTMSQFFFNILFVNNPNNFRKKKVVYYFQKIIPVLQEFIKK